MTRSAQPSDILQTTITGSLPKPAWLADPGILFAPWRVDDEVLAEAQADAESLVLLDQHAAGLDIVTDGEQRRRHYIWGFIEGLTGIDLEQLGEKLARGGRYTDRTAAPRIVDEVRWNGPVLAEGVRAARAQTDRPLKITLPGPMTIADSTLDEHYGDGEEAMAMRFAEILNREAQALVEAGADIVQFDEPTFNIYLEQLEAWGIEALSRAAAGLGARTAVHICYGYGVPNVLRWKDQNQEWGHYGTSLPLIAQSPIDMVSVECAASGVDPAVLAGAGDKQVMLGVIDVGTEEVETPEVVAARIEAALPYVTADRLIPATDCGMVPRSRPAARGKMEALAAGAALARQRLGG